MTAFRLWDGVDTISGRNTTKVGPGGAGTPNRGLADREEHDRLMASLPCPADINQPPCPICGHPANQTHVRELSPSIRLGLYVCPAGHPWETRWLAPVLGVVP